MHKKFYSFRVICVAFVLFACADHSSDSEVSATAPSRFSMVTGKHLFAVDGSGKYHAWIVGFDGTILHTSNGGEDWFSQAPPIEEDLYDVCFIDTQTGWIVGKHGTILHTQDGGKHWKAQQRITEQRLFDVHFIDVSTGWAVGTMGTILHTVDGGNSWTKQGWDEDRYYNGVVFVDEYKGWVVGEYATIDHTENGGETWVPQTCEEIQPIKPEKDFPPPPPNLYGVLFQDENAGCATGMDGIVIKTEDGGKTWKRATPKADFSLYQVALKGNNVRVVGAQGSYLTSSDGGSSWNRIEDKLGTNFWLRDLVFTDDRIGWIVGAAGTILKTDDGGNTWKKISGVFYK